MNDMMNRRIFNTIVFVILLRDMFIVSMVTLTLTTSFDKERRTVFHLLSIDCVWRLTTDQKLIDLKEQFLEILMILILSWFFLIRNLKIENSNDGENPV